MLGLKALATPNGKIALSDVDSPGSVARDITTRAEQSYKNIHTQSRNVSVFENDQFGAFLKAQFQKMNVQSMASPQPYGHATLPAQHEPDKASAAESSRYNTTGVKTFLIESTNHAMLLRLRVKEKQGLKLCVASFYDPNRTACLVRCEVSDLEELQSVASSYSLTAFINPVVNGQVYTRKYNRYFPANTAAIALALEVPDLKNGACQPVEAKGRRLQSFDCKVTPTFMFHLMGAGFAGNIDDIVTPTVDLLAAKQADGTPGLFMAIRNGKASAIRAFGNLLNDLPPNSLTIRERAALIFAIDGDSETAVSTLLAYPNDETTQAWTDLLKSLPVKLPDAALEALKNKNQHGSVEALRKALHAVVTDTNA